MSGTILFISDIEGCLISHFDKIPQNVSLCDENNYKEDGALYKYLNNNTDNKIAFLGDYFDKGPSAAGAIKGIHNLKTKFPDRVTIILGNRDVNKYRFAFELDTPITLEDDSIFPDWENFPDLFNACVSWENKGSVWKTNMKIENWNFGQKRAQIHTILTKTMGANGYDNNEAGNKMIDNLVHFFNPTFFNDDDNFDIDADIQTALDTIYREGKIVDFDSRFQVLMSHGGGFDHTVFSVDYNAIKGALDSKNYFKDMETARKALEHSNLNSNTLTPDKLDLNKYNQLSIDSYNLIKSENKEENKKSFYILQASGLKPKENPGENSQQFASFIQSCPSGCSKSGLSNYLGTMSNKLKNTLNTITVNKQKIKFVAHGHTSHCLPYPLIVKYKGSDVVFIHNDMSNGQRPTEKVGESIQKLPFACIENGTAKVITMTGDGTLSDTSIIDNGIFPLEIQGQIIDANNTNKKTTSMNDNTGSTWNLIHHEFDVAEFYNVNMGGKKRSTRRKRRSVKTRRKSSRRNRRRSRRSRKVSRR